MTEAYTVYIYRLNVCNFINYETKKKKILLQASKHLLLIKMI